MVEKSWVLLLYILYIEDREIAWTNCLVGHIAIEQGWVRIFKNVAPQKQNAI
jgi:hypothetical protein